MTGNHSGSTVVIQKLTEMSTTEKWEPKQSLLNQVYYGELRVNAERFGVIMLRYIGNYIKTSTGTQKSQVSIINRLTEG
jgi:hypothetical protein